MKSVLWIGGLLLTALGANAWAQEYTYVTNPGTGAVRVFDSQTLAALPAGPDGPNPMAIAAANRSIGVLSRNRIYVANRLTNPGVISIIDTRLLRVVKTVTITGSANLGGLAVSEDTNTLFIAGRRPAAPAQAGVFSLDLNDETTQAYVGGLNSASSAADCEVIPALLVGGTGNGPGRVYFSSPADNVIGVLYLAGPVGSSTIAPPATTSAPSQMERSPDGTFVLVACSSSIIPERKVIRVVPSPPANTTDALTVTIGFGMSPVTTDVTFRGNQTAPPFTSYFCTQDPSGDRLHQIEVSPTGAITNSGSTVINGFTNEVRHDPFTDRVYVADLSGTGNNFVRLNAATTPPSAPTPVAAGAAGPLSFTFAPAPPDPTVDSASPTAEISSAPFQIEIKGTGFIAGSSRAQIFNLSFPVDATTTTVIDPETIRATFPAQAAGLLWHVIVINNSGRSGQINQYFETMAANPPIPPFTAPIPSMGQGYRLVSLPQYAQITDLRAALSAQLGPYNPVLYRVFLYQNAQYVELNQTDPASFLDLTGKGFWALSRNGSLLTMTSPDVTQNTPGGRRVTALAHGWNMISQPWINGPTNTILYTNVQVSPNGNLVPLVAASVSVDVSNQPFAYVGGQYVLVNQMTAGEAYWVFNNNPQTIYMIIDRVNVTLKAGSDPPPVYTTPPSGTALPPGPPGSEAGGSGSSGGVCGLMGAELLLLLALVRAVFPRAGAHRKLAA